jgi:gliding motility-associated-like protein
MQQLLRVGEGVGRAAWQLVLVVLALSWLCPLVAHASHIRAGDIQSRVDEVSGNPNHILFRMTIYRDKSSSVPQGLDDTTIFFGDNTSLNGADTDASGKALMTRISDPVNSTADTEVLYFDFEHIYGGAGTYLVSFIGEFRNAGIVNMTAPDATTFYVGSTVTINPAYGINHSPVLRAPAVDKAGVRQVFLHNPAAYDADGDSLAFKLRTCQQVVGGVTTALIDKKPKPVDCTNYRYPADQSISPGAKQVPYSGVPVGNPLEDAIIVQDPLTGQITWNAPSRVGFYNIAFVVEEWRRTAFGKRLIGTVIRDMQIIVTATNNLPPTITVPADVCVIAGTPVTLTVSATDGVATGAAAPTPITLTAYSGIIPPATFTQTTTGTTSTGTFRWTPECSNVAKEPYIVVFKAQDSPPASSGNPILIDERPVRITVVGPPPQNLRSAPATSTKLTSIISWDRYTCQNASQLLIFRKEGPYSFTPSTCQTGLPAGSGYVQVGSVSPSTTSFADDNGGAGLSRGKTYCYRIYAVFPLPAGGASLVSNETCLSFGGRPTRLTNVDVNTTATVGQITVKWTQPRADNNGTYGAPFGYRLSRGVGSNPATFTPVATFTSLSDTTYVDRTVNTTDNQYTYQLTFFNTDRASGTAIEQTEVVTASSVRTSLVPNADKTITVNWAYQVPWTNTQQPTLIFRRDPTPGSAFVQVGTATSGATSGTFTDRDAKLQFGRQYCYYVQTNGQYPDLVNSANQLILRNLLNNSQQQCTQLNAVPCTPVLSLRQTNCDSLAALPLFPQPGQLYRNNLSWSVGNTPAACSAVAAYYRVLRSEVSGGPYVAIDSTKQLSYVHQLLNKATGCYVVQAVDSTGLRSAFSNVVCQDECAFFLLPNIFTPNGDNLNETFHPKTTSPVRRTHVQIFSRWGRKVYDSDKDPYINWTGATQGEGTNGLVSNGLYYYLAEVEFDNTANTKRTFKGWVELVR